MLLPAAAARGTPQVVGAQWLNQTYNALHYRANRNASNTEENVQILQARVPLRAWQPVCC